MPSPARVSWAKFRTIAVSSVALTILGVLFYLLSGGTIFQEKALLYLYIPDAAGLGPDSPVRVDGISVGKVAAIEFSGSNDLKRVVKITLSVGLQNLSAIPADSYAQISTETLVGDKFVDITSGRSPERLHPGSELAFREQADMLKSIDMQQLETNLREVDQLLTGIENGTSRVGQFVIGEKMYADLLRRIGSLERALRRAASDTSQIGQIVYGNELYRRIRDPLIQLDFTLAKVQSGQGSLGQLLRDSAQYEKLRNDAQNLSRTVADLRSQELLQSEKGYADWNRAIDALIRAVDDFNAQPMLATSALYDNFNGLARELRDSMKDFRGNPKKYLRLKIF